MPVIWQKTVGGTAYRVVQAGGSIRLYSNGVFHSQYNPNQLFSGNLWDLLALPALLHVDSNVKRVLVLGVGGGAVINLLQHTIAPALTVGVDLNAVHLNIAKTFFKVDGRGTLLLQADAKRWLDYYTGPLFDVVIDDLFGEINGEPSRAVEVDSVWWNKLQAITAPDGVCIVNFDSDHAFQNSAIAALKKRSLQQTGFTLQLPLYQNVVAAVFGRGGLRCAEQDVSRVIDKELALPKKLVKTLILKPIL